MQYSDVQLLASFLNYLAATAYSSFAYVYISNLISTNTNHLKQAYFINSL